MRYFNIKVNRLSNYLKAINSFKLSTVFVGKWSRDQRIFRYFMGLFYWYLLANSSVCYGRDFGVVNNLFPIAELHFSQGITKKIAHLSPEQIAKIKKAIQKRAQEIINRPKGNKLPRATKYTRRVFDSSATATDDIVDHKGNVIYPKGAKVDPFHNQYGASSFLTRDWLFFDGDDVEQVKWASKLSGGLILVNGSPVEVSQKLDRHVYFDQMQAYAKRLNLGFLPARLSQVGVGCDLIIEEFVI